MKKSRFTESQIFTILKEVDAGMKVETVCRKHGISNATYYNWKSKYGGMDMIYPQSQRHFKDEISMLSRQLRERHWRQII